MSKDTFVLIAFCVFALLVGIRIRQRIQDRKQKKQGVKVNKNQRSKVAQTEEPAIVKEKRERREKRVRRFTIIQLVVLFGLMIYMIPALTKDILMPDGVNFSNLFLRCLIFIFTSYIFILGYLKVFGKKNKEKQD